MADYLRNLLNTANDNYSNEILFNAEVNLVKSCFSTVLRVFKGILTFFDISCYLDKNLLSLFCKSLLENNLNDTSEIQQENIFNTAFHTMQTFTDITLDIHSAYYLYGTTKLLAKLCGKLPEIPDLAKKYFCHKWLSNEKKLEQDRFSVKILKEFIIDFYPLMAFNEIELDLKNIKKNIRLVLKENFSVQNYPNITNKNFTLLYEGLSKGLAHALESSLQLSSEPLQNLHDWKKCFELLHEFYQISKFIDISKTWSCFLSVSYKIFTIYSAQGIKLIKETIVLHTSEVVVVIKLMQKLTRLCNQLCVHSKVIQDKTVIKQIPEYRALAEKLINEMASALAANNLLPQVWEVAQLKNKNIYGEEVLSQNFSIKNKQITEYSLNNSESYNDEDMPDKEDSEVFE